MTCPTCSLIKPPKAEKCDCGYAFQAMRAADTPGWRITMGWSQRLAAYWSISWPAWTGATVLGYLFLMKHAVPLRLASTVVFFCLQCLLTLRLTRKKYRSFRIHALRGSEPGAPLSLGEAGLVWLWTAGPQVAFVLSVSVLAAWYGPKLLPEVLRGLLVWANVAQIVLVGPYAVGLAMRASYRGFRLQGYGLRYK
jgi:hypothetical protein